MVRAAKKKRNSHRQKDTKNEGRKTNIDESTVMRKMKLKMKIKIEKNKKKRMH